MKVKDFVKIDQQGEFISAVQLSDFDSADRNRQLVSSFIFSDNAPDAFGMEKKYYGTINLLEKFINSFKSPTSSNVLMVLADYGHGKSHFALEALNYFEKPLNSPELGIVLDRIKLAIPNQADKAEKFNTFKQVRERFLVMYLDGTSGKSIKEMLFAALKQGLRRYDPTGTLSLPFWNEGAFNWLTEKKDDPRAKEFLAKTHRTDFVNLLQDVQANKDGAWEQYAALFKFLNHEVEPNASGNKNPKEVINWIVEAYVGDNKPFTGLILFFDEFSQFIRFYSKDKMDGTLMNLLEGVGENKQKALMVGFGQHDPGEIVRDAAQNQSVADNIQKELNRLEEKFNLYSLVESVLDSYLSNSSESWDRLINENSYAKAGFLGEVSEYSWELFYNRYSKELKWDNQKFREVVVKGCYPLHPTTTGLLARLKMVSDLSDDARTMLRFVHKAYDLKKDEEIIVDGKVNWVYPIELIDHFEEKIIDSISYVEYTTALQNLHTILAENVTTDQIKMLKAMLIQKADQRFSYNKIKQVELLSHYCGLDTNEGKRVLKTLSENNIIRYIENPGSYIFWQTGINPQALEKEIKNRLLNRNLDTNALLKLENRLTLQSDLFDGFKPIEVSLNWGNQIEWAAEQKIFTREGFTKENILKLVPPFAFRLPSVKQPVKGAVVWCLPLYDEDVIYFRQKAAEILDSAFEYTKTPPPILLILPGERQWDLTSLYLRYEILMEMSHSEQAKKDFGGDQILGEINKTVKNLQDKFKDFFSRPSQKTVKFDDFFSVSTIYLSQISNMALGNNPIQKILEELYRKAYVIRPNEFFKDKGFNNSKVTQATKKVAAYLAKNNIKTALEISPPSPVEKRLIETYLVREWKILSTGYFIVEPVNVHLKKAWDYLDESIQADQNEVKLINIIPKLLSVPFGFDFNTALLLFSAWVGFNNKEISFSRRNQKTTVKTLFDDISIYNKPTAQLMLQLLLVEHLAISREDPSVIETEIKAIMETIKASACITKEDALIFSAKLQDFLEKEEGASHYLESDCKNILQSLTIHLEELEQYNQQADEIYKEVHSRLEITSLQKIEKRIQKLNYPKFIKTEKANLDELQRLLDKQYEACVDEICAEPEKLKSIENVGIVRKKIEDHQDLLSDHKDLVQKLSSALDHLEKKAEQLKEKENEESLMEQIRLISEDSPLQKLQEDLNFIKSKQYPANVNNLVNIKVERMKTKVAALQKFADGVLERYQVIDKTELRAFKENLLSRMNLYQNSPYQEKLFQVKNYCDELDRYYNELAYLSRINTTNLSEIQKGIEKLESVRSLYQNKISEEHMTYLLQFKNKFDQAHQEIINEFEKGLSELESILKMELEQVSGSLPIVDFRNKITTLRTNNLDGFKNRLDKVENDFNKIVKEMNEKHTLKQIENLYKMLDNNKKQICLQRLKDL